MVFFIDSPRRTCAVGLHLGIAVLSYRPPERAGKFYHRLRPLNLFSASGLNSYREFGSDNRADREESVYCPLVQYVEEGVVVGFMIVSLQPLIRFVHSFLQRWRTLFRRIPFGVTACAELCPRHSSSGRKHRPSADCRDQRANASVRESFSKR